MDPITAAMLASTALSAGGSLLGASNASSASERDYARKQQEFAQSMQLARQQYQDAMLGMTTGSGSSLKFVPGQGWVTTLGATDQAELARNARSGEYADTVLRQAMGYKPISGEQMSGLLYDKATRGLNDRMSAALSSGLTTATRQGNDRLAAAMLASIGKQGAEEDRNARVDSEIAGREYADKANINNRNAFANLYGSFADRSSGDVGPTKYIPALTKGAESAGKNLLAVSGSDASKTPSGTELGSALASIGQLGYGAASAYQAGQKQDQYLDLLRKKYLKEDTPYNTGVG